MVILTSLSLPSTYIFITVKVNLCWFFSLPFRHLFPLKHFNEVPAKENPAKECYGCQKTFTDTAADKNVSYIVQQEEGDLLTLTFAFLEN